MRAGDAREADAGRDGDEQPRPRASRSRALGGDVVRTQVGDRYVVEEMRAERLQLRRRAVGPPRLPRPRRRPATASSPRCACSRSWWTAESRCRSSARHGARPQVLLNIKVSEKREIGALPSVTSAIRSAEETLGGAAVCWSGTRVPSYSLRVMLEGENEEPDPASRRRDRVRVRAGSGLAVVTGY